MEKNISFSIEHHCPQCGAPVFLDEADRFFVCQFCRVRSCISQKGFGRYYISPHPELDPSKEIFYLPYWRFKGVEYTCTETGVAHRFMDLSWLALENPSSLFPFSLGFRSQALTLKRVSARTRGRFIRPWGFKQSFPSPKTGRTATPSSPLFREHIGETLSLIYAPFYQEGSQIFDGVLNQPVGRVNDEDQGIAQMLGPGCRPEKETQILSGLCPGCGWDLIGQSDSLVLSCTNCHSLWKPRNNQLHRIRFGCAPMDTTAETEQVWIPFWKFLVDIKGIDLNENKDLMAFANLTGSDRGPNPSERIHFWTPAFKIRPKVFLRLSSQLTLAQPDLVLDKKLGPALFPITLPASEGIQSIKVTLAGLGKPIQERLPQVQTAALVPQSATLVFLPFEKGHHDYQNTALGLSINCNILHLSGNL